VRIESVAVHTCTEPRSSEHMLAENTTALTQCPIGAILVRARCISRAAHIQLQNVVEVHMLYMFYDVKCVYRSVCTHLVSFNKSCAAPALHAVVIIM
jgi:hypothetical protein